MGELHVKQIVKRCMRRKAEFQSNKRTQRKTLTAKSGTNQLLPKVLQKQSGPQQYQERSLTNALSLSLTVPQIYWGGNHFSRNKIF